MENIYGIKRVMEPAHVLPTSAWRVDNNREIYPNEMRISIEKVHVESTSFRQICIECSNHENKIRERLRDIVIKRGKLHNPVTDTGGVVFGRVEEIGAKYQNRLQLQPGDPIICNASMAAIPLYISRIGEIDMSYMQIDVEGYAILSDELPIVKQPENVPINLLLYTLDESGTLYSAYNSAKKAERCLVVGNNLLTNLLFGVALRQAAPQAEILCLFDVNAIQGIRGRAIDELLKKTFNQVEYIHILKPVASLESLDIGLFDVSVNCADIPGAETVNILSTKPGGTVYFANLINNYNIALYITESISRQIHIRCADGYTEDYADFDIQLVQAIAPYLEKASAAGYRIEDNIAYPLGRSSRSYEQTVQRKSLVEDFICESRAMSAVLDEILSVAKYDCNVLITGETGVGKEKVASLIQKNSTRRMQPFVKINCASIAENLIESEFFGYEKGSFTGANASGKKGYFETADNGTIFLDEIGELPLDLQAKLLRVLQEGEFFRVGGTTSIKTNVRILSATNRDLEELIENKSFRRDLYYRLNVFPIRVPDLSERKAEIPALVMHFLEKYNEKFGIERTIDDAALDYMQNRSWPGNIRELENVVQRLLITAKGESVTVFDVMKELHLDLFETIGGAVNPSDGSLEGESAINLDVLVENFEKNIIKYACDKYGSSRKAAKAIGISQTQLVRKKNKYGLTKKEEELGEK